MSDLLFTYGVILAILALGLYWLWAKKRDKMTVLDTPKKLLNTIPTFTVPRPLLQWFLLSAITMTVVGFMFGNYAAMNVGRNMDENSVINLVLYDNVLSTSFTEMKVVGGPNYNPSNQEWVLYLTSTNARITVIIDDKLNVMKNIFYLPMTNDGTVNPSPTPTTTPTATPIDESNLESIHVLGNSDATNELTIFADFECPYCAMADIEVIDAVSRSNGDLKVYYKQFPLTSIHNYAMNASIAAECAGLQGKFFEMHNKMFNAFYANLDASGQPTANYAVRLNNINLIKYATELELDIPEFSNCLSNPPTVVTNNIQKDMADANRIGIGGTPSLFLNGKSISPTTGWDGFAEIILEGLM